jgi:two-component system OmpR family response regulator/two-component system alkaline phosphatase synthesis response regulator PhoP
MRETSILVVEDEPSIAEVVSLYLKRAGYRVLLARDGQAALQLMERQMPDLLILDLMLPKVDGYEIARWVRGQGDTPIIILTARREEYDRIAGLEMGADDYVVKPFSPQELVSRVRAVLRRTRRGLEAAGERPLDFGDVTIDPQTHLVTVAGKEVTLTAVEFDMLWLMAQNPRRVFSRQQLLERVWGQSEYIDPGTVTVHVRRLREKIERDPSNPEHIVTLWGVGYKFEP